MSVQFARVSRRRAEHLVLPCIPEGSRKYVVDPHSLHDLPKGTQAESMWLAKVGWLVDLLCDNPFFIKSEAVFVRKVADENREAPPIDNTEIHTHSLQVKH